MGLGVSFTLFSSLLCTLIIILGLKTLPIRENGVLFEYFFPPNDLKVKTILWGME